MTDLFNRAKDAQRKFPIWCHNLLPFGGGIEDGGSDSNTLDIYNTDTDSWTTDTLPYTYAYLAADICRRLCIFCWWYES
jgi:hypothetical protein